IVVEVRAEARACRCGSSPLFSVGKTQTRSAAMRDPAAQERNPLMTFEQAAYLDPEEHPGEIDEGRWVPVTRNTLRHGQILINAGVLLKLYARTHPGWIVSGGDPGTKLRHDPDVLRGPDVAMVRAERAPQGKGADGWLEGAPELA